MGRCWVVLLEVTAENATLELETVEALVARLEERHPSALYAPDRCAVQFLIADAGGPAAALATGVGLFRAASRAVDFPDGELVRAEVKTPAELAAEYDGNDDDGAGVRVADERALAAAYGATRRLLRSTSPREAVSVLSALVRQLGGTTIAPRPGDPRALDVDLSLGEGDAMVAAAEPYSVARLSLEEVLPAAAEDARRVVDFLRAAANSDVSGPSVRVALADLDVP